MKKYKYEVYNGFVCMDLAVSLNNFFQSKNMESQILTNDNTCIIVQARSKKGFLRENTGLEKACTVELKLDNNTLETKVGEGKWADKFTGAAVGWFITWPLLATAAYGAYKQAKLPNEVDAFIQKYIGSRAVAQMNTNTNRTYVMGEVVQTEEVMFCTNCGASKVEDAMFCSKCGKPF